MKKIIWTIVIAAAVFGIIYLLYSSFSKKDRRISELETSLRKESSQTSKFKATKDSLARVNFYLSRFRVLTDAMWYRDSLINPLKYKIGDRVILKRDSSKVLVTDVIIGGSKYDFYVKYRVIGKDKSTEEVVPELIY